MAMGHPATWPTIALLSAAVPCWGASVFATVHTVRTDQGFFKRLRQVVLAVGSVALLKNGVLFTILSLLPRSILLKAAVYDIPTFAFYFTIVFWVVQMSLHWGRDIRHRGPPMWVSYFHEHVCVVYGCLFLICASALLALSQLHHEYPPAIFQIGCALIGIVLTVRMVYVMNELYFFSLTQDIAVPVVRRMRWTFPVILVVLILGYAVEFARWFGHLRLPFQDPHHSLDGITALWAICFRILPDAVLIFTFSAPRQGAMMLRHHTGPASVTSTATASTRQAPSPICFSEKSGGTPAASKPRSPLMSGSPSSAYPPLWGVAPPRAPSPFVQASAVTTPSSSSPRPPDGTGPDATRLLTSTQTTPTSTHPRPCSGVSTPGSVPHVPSDASMASSPGTPPLSAALLHRQGPLEGDGARWAKLRAFWATRNLGDKRWDPFDQRSLYTSNGLESEGTPPPSPLVEGQRDTPPTDADEVSPLLRPSMGNLQNPPLMED